MGKKNVLITFCGMDGTGKSTLANRLVTYLQEKEMKVKYNHGHGYAISQNSFTLNENKVRQLRKFLTLLWPLAYFDNLVTYFKYKRIMRTQILVSDRYFYDKVSRLMFYGVLNKFMARIYLSLLPKPTYAFVLTANPETVTNRKKEYSIEENGRFKNNYEFIAHHLNLPLISTEKSQEESFKEILSFIETDEN